jgi:hypothetical protein
VLRILLWVVGVAAASTWPISGHADGVEPSPSPGYGELLATYVRGDRVAYAEWKRRPSHVAALHAWIVGAEARGVPADSSEALAHWLNLYNALTLEIVLAHYPIASIRDIHPGEPERVWKENRITVGGEPMSLDGIEARLRTAYHDPRLHFALNCASLGCPPLSTEPFTAADVDAQLDAIARRVVNDPRWVRLDEDSLRLSQIFEWYRGDFEAASGSLAGFLARYRPVEEHERLRALESEPRYVDYDWSLNDIEEP